MVGSSNVGQVRIEPRREWVWCGQGECGAAVALGSVVVLTALGVPLHAQSAIPLGMDAAGAAPGRMSIGSAVLTEGNSLTSSMAFVVSAPTTSSSPMRATYTTMDGTAVAPADYSARTGTVTIPGGATNVTVVVPIVGDTIDESNEAFTVRLSNPVNATIVNGTGTGTITDNDAPPVVSVGTASATEPNSGSTPMVFTITTSVASSFPVTVNYQTVNGTATAPADYTAASGSRTIPAGSTSTTVSVPVVGDVLYEGNETYTLRISNPVNATLGTTNGTGTILENDARPTVTANGTAASEGNAGTTPMVFTVVAVGRERRGGLR